MQKRGLTMKTHLYTRMLAALLCLLLILPVGLLSVSATETQAAESESQTSAPSEQETEPPAESTTPETESTPDESEPDADTEPEKPPIAIPDTWAHDALAWSVDNGVMQGDASGNLLPEHATTRAELATMTVRLFHAQEEADLSGFKDVPKNSWFYSAMARSVAMGIFTGNTNKTLTPDAKITREQAFTVLGRAFGQHGGSLTDLSKFSDAAAVSTYAVPFLGAMVKNDYIHGGTDGRLNPAAPISRQEMAQVLYNLLGSDGALCDAPDAIPSSGNVLYRSSEPIPAGTVIQGDLIFACSGAEALRLDQVTVTGRVALRCDTANLSGCTIGALSTGSAAVTSDQTIDQVFLTGTGASYTGNARTLLASSAGSLTGSFETVCVQAGPTTIGAGSQVGALSLDNRNVAVVLNGTANTTVLNERADTVSGSGNAGAVTIYGKQCSVTCGKTSVSEKIDAGVEYVKIAVTTGHKATPSNSKVTLRAAFSNVDTTYGAVNGARNCTLVWYMDGRAIKTVKNFALKNGATDSVTVSFTFRRHMNSAANVLAKLFYEDETALSNISTIQLENYSDYYYATADIKTIYVQARVTRGTYLYSYMSLAGRTSTYVPAGTIVYYNNHNGTSTASVTTTDFKATGWVPYSSISIIWGNYVQPGDYTAQQKQDFVNAKGYSSSTGWLVWVNLYHTKVNVFTGSKGNWKLVKSFNCAIGNPNTPTPIGIYKIQSQERYTQWNYDDFYVNVITRFNGGYAFHTRKRSYYTGGYIMNDYNVMASHGCVRLNVEDAVYLRDTVRLYSTVVVY